MSLSPKRVVRLSFFDCTANGIRDRQRQESSFQPTEIHAPANVPIELRVKNLDPAPMEFESVSLRVEKVVTGNGEGVIRLRPLAPGRYEFFDDFHQETRGALVAR
jgi:hypothetical protein